MPVHVGIILITLPIIVLAWLKEFDGDGEYRL